VIKRYTNFILWSVTILIFAVFTVTLDIRPGRLWHIVNVLLFENSILDLIQYALVFTASLISVVLLLASKNRIIRFSAWTLFGVLCIVNSSYRIITGYEFMYNDWLLAKSNSHFLSQVFQQFLLAIIISSVATVAIIWLCNSLLKKKSLRANSATLFFVPIGFLFVYYEISQSAGNLDQFPFLARIPAIIIHHAWNPLPTIDREQVEVTSHGRKVNHLFLIVDESITGRDLQLNGNPFPTTPFLNENRSRIINFGIATSYTNYSAGSNIALTTGARMNQLPDKSLTILHQPTIYQYAKKAGFKTYLIDAQMMDYRLQNFLTDQDRPYIDSIIQLSHLQKNKLLYEERDQIINGILSKLACSPVPVFVYVVKFGAHWPYARTYPDSMSLFKPVLSRSSLIRDSIKTRNTYYNAIRWSVDLFWKRIIEDLNGKDSTMIVYTSDHGQDISKQGIQISHASIIDVSPREANVPLWMYSNYPHPFTSSHRDERHHQDIFPTLLFFMGYSKDFIVTKYGPTLLDSSYAVESRKFLTGDIFNRANSALIRF